MAPVKRKICCVPYCNNVQELSKKQFFKIGANLEGREKWLSRVGKAIAAKSQVLYCCEDHFDLPNDAENYIRCKYIPGTQLKLRSNVLPQKKLPVNVCRLCLKLIFNGDDFVDISEKKGCRNAQVIAATLPELDLSITVEPVACVKCFEPLDKYHRIKQNALKSEVIVVNCIKSILKRSPTRLIKNCEIDLFEEYNDIMELIKKEQEKAKIIEESSVVQDQSAVMTDKREMDQSTEEIVIQIEEPTEDKYQVEADYENNVEIGENRLRTLLEEGSKYRLVRNTLLEQDNCNLVENESDKSSSTKIGHVSGAVESNRHIEYAVVENPMEISSETMYIDIGNESVEKVLIVTEHL